MWTAQEKLSSNAHRAPFHTGFDTSHGSGLDPAQLHRVLDEVDYGLMVVDAQGRLHHVNHLARHELASGHIALVDIETGATTPINLDTPYDLIFAGPDIDS